uniref:ArsR family transcriptional regulator n=1 Tax=Thermofilum pendens TaxID=2269 RepID=A0A7C4BAG8_THEPE
MLGLIFTEILYELKRNNGVLGERELLDVVRKTLADHYQLEVSEKEVRKALLALEVRGLVTLSTLKKNMRMVKLNSK